MTDAVLALATTADGAGHELGSLRLGDRALRDVLESSSWRSLVDTVAVLREHAGSAEFVVLFTRDGRTLEADLLADHGTISLELHDVTRHVDEADRFARLAMQLHRRSRDLETLVDASSALGSTLDVPALVRITAETVGEYLFPLTVVVTAGGHESGWGRPRAELDPEVPVTARALTTPRGDLGTVAWWRVGALTADESRVLDAVCRRAAVGIDHALLLAPPPAGAERDEHGLLRPPAARRALAGFVRPHAVAVVATDDGSRDHVGLAAATAACRAGDVRASWSHDRIVVALAGAGVAELCGWLARAGLGGQDADGALTSPYVVGIAVVRDDVDGAIARASATADHARATGRALLVADAPA